MGSFNTTYIISWLLCNTEKDKLCVLLYAFLISCTAVIVSGNLLVLISIIYFKQLHTPTNYLILSLAVADVLIGAVIFPFGMLFALIPCLYYPTLLCNLRNTVDITIGIASLLNLCCISIDRYHAVCQPLIYSSKMTDSVAVKMGLGSWAVAFIIGIWYFLLFFYTEACDIGCRVILIVVFIVAYYIPTTILMCMYCKVLFAALKQARSIQNKANQSSKSGTGTNKERKATKTLSIVMGLFLICWAPLFLLYPLNLVSDDLQDLFEPFNWFALSNSMFNPFIYGFFYTWFRSAFKLIISGKIFRGDVSNAKLH